MPTHTLPYKILENQSQYSVHPTCCAIVVHAIGTAQQLQLCQFRQEGALHMTIPIRALCVTRKVKPTKGSTELGPGAVIGNFDDMDPMA